MFLEWQRYGLLTGLRLCFYPSSVFLMHSSIFLIMRVWAVFLVLECYICLYSLFKFLSKHRFKNILDFMFLSHKLPGGLYPNVVVLKDGCMPSTVIVSILLDALESSLKRLIFQCRLQGMSNFHLLPKAYTWFCCCEVCVIWIHSSIRKKPCLLSVYPLPTDVITKKKHDYI